MFLIFILSSTMDWYLEVRIQAIDRLYSFLPIDHRDKGHQDLAKIDFNKPRRAHYLHSAWKKHQDAVFGLMLIFRFKKELTFDQFQLIAFQKLWDWRLEKSYLRILTCLFDHHQRSHYDTITIGPKGKFIRVLRLNNSQKVKLFDSLEEKFKTQHSPN